MIAQHTTHEAAEGAEHLLRTAIKRGDLTMAPAQGTER